VPAHTGDAHCVGRASSKNTPRRHPNGKLEVGWYDATVSTDTIIKKMKRNLPLLIIGAVLVLAFGAGLVLYRTMKPTTDSGTPTPTANKPPALPGADPPRVRGGANATVTIEEFGDFECPPCGALHPELVKIEREFGDRLRIVFREYPLQMHKHAYDAAQAAEAAGLQDKFWEMHDLLYEKKDEWPLAPDPRTLFVDYAKVLGLDEERFSRDMIGELASMRVALDMRRGKSMGVLGTPTLFINGRQMDPAEMTADGLRLAINRALNEKK
jgi:protein-disulfide isomerase